MWATVRFEPIAIRCPEVDSFIIELREVYTNGKVEFAAFAMPDHPVFEWYLSELHPLGFFEQFWKRPEVREIFPYNLMDMNFFDFKIFSYLSPFLLDGMLALILSNGGAYGRFTRGGAEAKRIGQEASLELLADDFDKTYVYESECAWSDFFMDVAWDHTYVIVDPTRRIIQVLLATDTD